MSRAALACVLGALVLAGTQAFAADGGAAEAARAAGDAGTSMSKPNHGEEDPDEARSPHAHGGMDSPPEDGALEDPSIPVGTISVHVADATGKPMPDTDVTLGILYNSVAKGESRKRVAKSTDATGRAVFPSLETGTGVAYRAMVTKDGATFAVPPFQLPAKRGMRALLHVYPVTSDVKEAVVATQAILYAEVKDDRVQIQEAFRIYNLGRTAWVPKDYVVPLPPGFTAFATQQGMTDVGIDAVPGQGVKLRGTIGPGQHVLEFRWQLPYSGQADVSFDVGMPANVAAARVIAPASKGMTLEVPGFPLPQSTSDGMGQRALVTEKQMLREGPALSSVTVSIKGLPTVGPGRVVATLLAVGGIILGIVSATNRPKRTIKRAQREKLLADLADLERARERGDVGPKTYVRARREILDDIARTLADDETSRPVKATRRKAVA